MGTQGTLAGSTSKLSWKYINPKQLPKRKVIEEATPDRSYNSEQLKFTEKSWDIEKDKNPGESGFYLDLFKTVRDKKALVITPENVRRQTWVIEHCSKLAPI